VKIIPFSSQSISIPVLLLLEIMMMMDRLQGEELS